MATSTLTDNGLLRFIACGSVDDGKSTLIGRLLFDSRAILVDALDAIHRTSQRRGLPAVDLSLLTDGLLAEREQGITIDVAYRYFSTGTRKFILADAPGHEQYTRNMVTGASTADLGILLIDARKGVLTQTRRHAALLRLMGIQTVVAAVNKMDLVGFSQEAFEAIRADVLELARSLGLPEPHVLPLSALDGDMVVERGDRLEWYEGPTIMELLEHAPLPGGDEHLPLRFPVQWVCRPRDGVHIDFRGYAGRIESGRVRVGDEILVAPSGRRSRIKAIRVLDQELPEASSGQSVILSLEDEIDISRGDLFVRPDQAPAQGRELKAELCWFSERPLQAGQTFTLRAGTREVRAKVSALVHRLDLVSLAPAPVEQFSLNEIGAVTLRLQHDIAADAYDANRASGAFILLDESTHATVAAGMVQSLE